MLTTTQAATVLGLEPRTVSKFIRRGVLKAEKFGRDWMIAEAEIERYQSERKKAGRPRKPPTK